MILVTGGAGFIGSHFARVAHDAGLGVIVLDDLSVSSSWPQLPEAVECVVGDIGDQSLVRGLVTSRNIQAVVHFAGRARIDESMRRPSLYFEQNLARTIALLEAVTSAVQEPLFILSSSAAVYGQAHCKPLSESAAAMPINPYGASKLAAEIALAAYGHARGVRWAALRYFNAAGAHPDGSLSERHDPETHLIPLALDAAIGVRPPLTVHGSDYATRDGTCIRDYVHVMDLAESHLVALEALRCGGLAGVLNLGSAQGHTIREVLAAVETVVGRQVPFTVGPKRKGDPAELVASVGRADELLGDRVRRSLAEIVEDAFRARRLL